MPVSASEKRDTLIFEEDAGERRVVKVAVLRHAYGDHGFAALLVEEDVALCRRVVFHNILYKGFFAVGGSLQAFACAGEHRHVAAGDEADAVMRVVGLQIFVQRGVHLVGEFVAVVDAEYVEVLGAVQIGHGRIIFFDRLVDSAAICADYFSQRILRVIDKRVMCHAGQRREIHDDRGDHGDCDEQYGDQGDLGLYGRQFFGHFGNLLYP